ncbi:MAG TPA: neprosin family prolyl endopeptidase [Thermoanaerobaculia bacterium]|nr:neprosin family prolyl endopeptidase [Thermoanaerobaculia bacterium]
MAVHIFFASSGSTVRTRKEIVEMKRIPVIISLGFLWLIGFGPAFAQAADKASFVSFQQFLQEVRIARSETFESAQGMKAQSKVEFGKMRQHILSLYAGVDVAHSFLLDDQVFDCVPVAQQPSVRQLGLDKVELEAPSPTLPDSAQNPSEPNVGSDSPLTQGLQDAFGNAVNCAEGTIPFRRVTLQEMTRFRTLEEFLHKIPDEKGLPGDEAPKTPVASHKYAHAYQVVKNYGGNSWLSLWSPGVDTTLGQVFSLSQHWYAGGSGKKTQTVEGGWQVYPAKYGTSKAALFIYWTADNYTKTGCYNLDCAGFVQTNSNWALGGTWTNYSTRGGPQFSFQMQWNLIDGRWWLFLQGSGNFEAVGYYPASLYRGGRLAHFADRVDYGGETVGTTRWSPMGSGAFASAGSGQAAYQSRIFYIKTPTIPDGGAWTSLKVAQPSPSCYRLIFAPFSGTNTDGSYFYFGGPGGGTC